MKTEIVTTTIHRKIIKLTEMEVMAIIVKHLQDQRMIDTDNPNIELTTEQGYFNEAVIYQETKTYSEECPNELQNQISL